MAKLQEYSEFYEVLPAEATDEVDTVEEDDPEAAFEDDDEGFDSEDDTDYSDESDDDDQADESEDEAEDADKSDDEESNDAADQKDKPKEELSEEDQRKAHNREMAERRISAKKEREAAVSQSLQDFINKADPKDPADKALREVQVQTYKNTVRANETELTNAYQRAFNDFEILRDQSPAIKREVDEALDAFQAMNVTVDQYGNPTDVRADLYAYLQAKADSIQQLTGRGVQQQAKAKAKEKSKALPKPQRVPKKGKSDEGLDAFDQEANRY